MNLRNRIKTFRDAIEWPTVKALHAKMKQLRSRALWLSIQSPRDEQAIEDAEIELATQFHALEIAFARSQGMTREEYDRLYDKLSELTGDVASTFARDWANEFAGEWGIAADDAFARIMDVWERERRGEFPRQLRLEALELELGRCWPEH